MPGLIPPSTRIYRSFLAATAEFQGGSDDASNTGQSIRKFAGRLFVAVLAG